MRPGSAQPARPTSATSTDMVNIILKRKIKEKDKEIAEIER